jgi:uncharacterized phage protein gp47/JayE
MKMAEKTWINKSEKEIRADIVAIAKEETKLTNFKSTGVLRSFVEVITKIVVFIYASAINMIYKNASLSGATGIFLAFWGLMLGVVRKQATKAKGNFTGTAYGDGSIPAGTWAVVPGTDLRYKVLEKVNFQEGETFLFSVEAEFPGLSHNIGSGTAIRLTRVIDGLDAVSVGEDWIVSYGQDAEEDDRYRERIEGRWKSQILGDIKEVYKSYAEAVDGVRAAHIVRAPRGPGSTDVVIASVIGLPNEELINAVKAALHDHELMAFDVQVFPPEVLNTIIEVEYRGDASEGAVSSIAEQYVYDLGIGGRLVVKDLYALFDPLKLKTIEIISPGRDVQPNERSVIIAEINVTRAEE